ncbi:DUF3108 domain-containing protein [Uliginosibacterium sp. H3]|uniref:DUF3108 domain-containing protein n=1 Tax=Uliginosibacterium silvisoli TaxID=3114758 RepID=A0ABU6K6C3_9RHOO|nr:DUF3108 domain-containing protein [Uliginosibacterium sp. H3]
MAVHLTALLVPGWQLPEDEDLGGKPLSAVLLAAPVTEPQMVAPRPAPKPAKPKQPAPPLADAPMASLGDTPVESSAPLAEATSAADQLPQSAPTVDVATAASAPEAQSQAVAQATSAPLADISGWARQGRVRYISSYYGLTVTGVQEWSRDDTQFSASLRGSVPIKGELIKQESSGRIVAGRPVSDSFRETFNAAQYETQFDAAGNTIKQVRKGSPREVETGGYALDMLALTHFMSLQPPGAPNFDVFVVTFRGSVSRVSIEQRPSQALQLPLGSISARQFHAEARNGSLKIDIWLANDWSNAPVRIRVEDNNGTYDLKAEEVELNGQVVGTRPSSAAAVVD